MNEREIFPNKKKRQQVRLTKLKVIFIWVFVSDGKKKIWMFFRSSFGSLWNWNSTQKKCIIYFFLSFFRSCSFFTPTKKKMENERQTKNMIWKIQNCRRFWCVVFRSQIMLQITFYLNRCWIGKLSSLPLWKSNQNSLSRLFPFQDWAFFEQKKKQSWCWRR